MIIKNGNLEKIQFDDIVNGVCAVPNGVISIGKNAFSEFQWLQTVKLPEGITVIDDGAFSGCTSLTKVEIPQSVQKIGNKAFYGCTKLSEVITHENLSSIGESAFYNCTSLKKINIPNNVSKIYASTFNGCSSLKEVNLSQNVDEIEKNAFRECFSLKNIKLPKNLRKIGKGAFLGCKNIKSINLEKELTEIDDNAFAQCSKLKEINIPDSVEKIGNHAFSNCSFLKNINIGKNVKEIGSYAFEKTAIRNINLPDSVKTVGSYLFNYCENLSSIRLSENLDAITQGMFTNCYLLRDFEIPSSVKKIGDSAFLNCNNLKNFIVPGNVQSIGKSAFCNCLGLTDITLNYGVKSIGDDVFDYSDIKSIVIPGSVESIGNRAFFHCNNLRILELQNGVKSIGNQAFSGCSNLREAVLPEKMDKIGESAFYDCEHLEKVNIPSGLSRIADYTFSGCRKLENVKIPDGVKIIGDSAFSACESIDSISIPSSVETIMGGAFYACMSLKNINFSTGLKKIDNNAFDGCLSLSNVVLPDGVETIGEHVFHRCPLEFLFVPYSVKSFGRMMRTSFELNRVSPAQNGLYFGIDPQENQTTELNFDVSILPMFWDYKDLLIGEQKNKDVADFYNFILHNVSHEDGKKLIESHNFKFFRKVASKYKLQESTYKLIYDLGGVSKPIEVNGKPVDYCQKIMNFLILKLDRKEVSAGELAFVAEHFDTAGFKKDFTDFFIQDFDQLMAEERKNDGFIARCYNEFERVQKTNTNNHGSQRQLKPTVHKFVDYFKDNKYVGITSETRIIADTISPYFSNQEDFDNAVKIFEEKNNKRTPDNILSVELKEKPFEKIDEYSEKIEDLQVETARNLFRTAQREFTWEWLSKNDPTNLIVGKLCNCCAHLDGVGYSIMKASIVDPAVQNIVIRDENGEIIAKSTMFVNKIYGYAVCNNIEVNHTVPTSAYETIYNKFMQGIKAFAEEYNSENPDNQIHQINVGDGFNDLHRYLSRNNQWTNDLLKGGEFEKYGRDGHAGYPGDSLTGQYIIWKNNKYSEVKDAVAVADEEITNEKENEK